VVNPTGLKRQVVRAGPQSKLDAAPTAGPCSAVNPTAFFTSPPDSVRADRALRPIRCSAI